MGNKCIFCMDTGDIFHTVEHIIPESLGNTNDILMDRVCDKCQNYFGREVENYVLTKTPFGFWRTMAGTLNKKGKSPFFDPSQNPKSKAVPDFNSCTDNGFTLFPVDNERIVKAVITNQSLFEKLRMGKRRFNIVMTPKMLIYMGRFLGKIALEYWGKIFGDDVYRKDLDQIRKYVRYGTTKFIWPIMQNHLLENLLYYKVKGGYEYERTLYAYSLYEINSLILFNFDIGFERYSIIINQKYPPSSMLSEQLLYALCKNAKSIPNILYYNLK